jgi:hypothetical protein
MAADSSVIQEILSPFVITELVSVGTSLHDHMDVARPSAKPLLLSYVKEQNLAQKEEISRFCSVWLLKADESPIVP